MAAEDTLPKLLLRNARQWPAQDAIREKEYGIWQTFSWSDYEVLVRRFALGLAALGFRRGDKLAVIGNNRPRLYGAMLAAQALGGISLGLYQDSIAQELSYVIDHSEASIVVAEDEEQVDKMLDMRAQIPRVRQVIYDDPRGLEGKEEPWLLHFPAVQARGDAFALEHPDFYERELAQGQGSDIALYSYTSGTTGTPKGAMLSHRNVISAFEGVLSTELWHQGDELMAYLPMAWIGDFAYSLVGSLSAGIGEVARRASGSRRPPPSRCAWRRRIGSSAGCSATSWASVTGRRNCCRPASPCPGTCAWPGGWATGSSSRPCAT